MLAVNLGPLAMPIGPLLLIGALLVAGAVGRVAGRAQKVGIGNVLIDMLIGAALAARVVFVILWFDIYRSVPWSMLDIRDGGFNPWAGIAAGALVVIWQAWRRAPLRKPLAIGLAAGTLAWGAMVGAFYLIDRSTMMPKVLEPIEEASECHQAASANNASPSVPMIRPASRTPGVVSATRRTGAKCSVWPVRPVSARIDTIRFRCIS